jgi:hypothetical protein
VSVVVDALQPLEQPAAGYITERVLGNLHTCAALYASQVLVCLWWWMRCSHLSSWQPQIGEHQVCSATDSSVTCLAAVLCLFVWQVRVSVGDGGGSSCQPAP